MRKKRERTEQGKRERTEQGKRIAMGAIRKGLTMGELAKAVGIHPNSLSSLCTGRSAYCSTEVLRDLAITLDVTADYLLEIDREL